MPTDADPPLIPQEVLESLEAVIFEAIGLTATALADASLADLTFPQWRVLIVVGRTDGLRVGEVATRIGASLTSTSRLITRLERRGYVLTQRDEDDRRATVVRLTDAGADARQRVIGRRRELMHEAFAKPGTAISSMLGPGLHELADRLNRYG